MSGKPSVGSLAISKAIKQASQTVQPNTQPTTAIISTVHNNKDLNFIQDVITIKNEINMLHSIRTNFIGDSDYSKALYNKQLIEDYLKPRFETAIRSGQLNNDETKELIGTLRTLTQEADTKLKEATAAILQEDANSSKNSSITPEQEAKAKEEICGELRKCIEGSFGWIQHLVKSKSYIDYKTNYEKDGIRLPDLTQQYQQLLDKCKNPSVSSGGGKGNYKKQPGARPSFSVQQATQKGKQVYGPNPVKVLGEDQFKQFLQQRRDALKGFKKNMGILLMFAADKLYENKDFMSAVVKEDDTISLDSALEQLSQLSGIEKPNDMFLQALSNKLKSPSIKSLSLPKMALSLVLAMLICIAKIDLNSLSNIGRIDRRYEHMRPILEHDIFARAQQGLQPHQWSTFAGNKNGDWNFPGHTLSVKDEAFIKYELSQGAFAWMIPGYSTFIRENPSLSGGGVGASKPASTPLTSLAPAVSGTPSFTSSAVSSIPSFPVPSAQSYSVQPSSSVVNIRSSFSQTPTAPITLADKIAALSSQNSFLSDNGYKVELVKYKRRNDKERRYTLLVDGDTINKNNKLYKSLTDGVRGKIKSVTPDKEGFDITINVITKPSATAKQKMKSASLSSSVSATGLPSVSQSLLQSTTASKTAVATPTATASSSGVVINVGGGQGLPNAYVPPPISMVGYASGVDTEFTNKLLFDAASLVLINFNHADITPGSIISQAQNLSVATTMAAERDLAAIDNAQALTFDKMFSSAVGAFNPTPTPKPESKSNLTVRRAKEVAPVLGNTFRELIKNPAAAGLGSIASLSSLQTILANYNSPLYSIKTIQKSNKDTYRDTVMGNAQIYTIDEASEFLQNYVINAEWDGNQHLLGDIAIITETVPFATGLFSAMGITGTAEYSAEPIAIYIQVLSKPSEENYKKQLNTLEENIKRVSDEQTNYLISDAVSSIDSRISDVTVEIQTLINGRNFYAQGLGSKEVTTVDPSYIVWASNGLYKAFGSAGAALSFTPTKVVNDEFKNVNNESPANREIRYQNWLTVIDSQTKAEQTLQRLKLEQTNIANTKANYEKQLLELNEEKKSKVASRGTLKSVSTVEGYIALDYANFDTLSPLVRGFLNKNKRADLDFALEYCGGVQALLDPTIAAFNLYDEHQIGTGLKVPDFTNAKTKAVLMEHQRASALYYRLQLHECFTKYIDTTRYLASINNEQIQSIGTNLAVSLGKNSNTLIPFVQRTKELSMVVAVAGLTTLSESIVADSPEDIDRILNATLVAYSASPFEQSVKDNAIYSLGRVASHGIKSAAGLVDGVFTILDSGQDWAIIIRDLVKHFHKHISAGLLIGGTVLYITIGKGGIKALPVAIPTSAAATLVGMVIDNQYGADSLPSNIIKNTIISVFVYKIVSGILFSSNTSSNIETSAGGQLPTTITNVSETTWFYRTPIWKREFKALQGLIEQLHRLDGKTNVLSKTMKESIRTHAAIIWDTICKKYKNHKNIYQQLSSIQQRDMKISRAFIEHTIYHKLIAGLVYLLKKEYSIQAIYNFSKNTGIPETILTDTNLNTLITVCDDDNRKYTIVNLPQGSAQPGFQVPGFQVPGFQVPGLLQQPQFPQGPAQPVLQQQPGFQQQPQFPQGPAQPVIRGPEQQPMFQIPAADGGSCPSRAQHEGGYYRRFNRTKYRTNRRKSIQRNKTRKQSHRTRRIRRTRVPRNANRTR